MSEQPLISVIVPIYNVEKYLRKCVNSILNQTYMNLEVILVDDGSTDNSPAICDEYAKEDDRVIVVHKANGGLSSSRNAGLDICRGSYIGFVDGDDYIEPNMYQDLLRAVQNEVGVIGVTAIAIESESGHIRQFVHENASDESKKIYIESLLLHKGDVSVWSKLFPRDIIGSHRFDETKLNEDLLFVFDIEKNIKKLRYTLKVGYHYVIHDGSISRSFGKAVHDMVGNSKTIRKYVECNYPQLRAQAERFEIYQNMAFLWSVPAEYKREEDILCKTTATFLKQNLWKGLRNPFLTRKDKVRLMMLAVLPVFAPRVYKIFYQNKRTKK